MKFGRLIFAGALWLAGTMAAHAQPPEEAHAEIPSLVRDAFESQYGRALVAELGKSLRKDADAACLSAKGIAPDQLEQRGRDLIVNLEMERPIRLANIADSIFEQFDRHLLVQRIKLTAVSPLGTGNEALLNKNPTEATEEKIDKFVAASKSPALKKYLKLSQQSIAASVAAMKKEDGRKAGPSAFFGGVEADLAELCIGPR